MHEYIKWKKSTTKNPATAPTYGRWVKRFLDFAGEQPITLELVMQFRVHLEVKYALKNVQFGLQIVRDYISYENTMGNLDFPIKLFKIPQERSNSHHAIMPEEYARMVATLDTSKKIQLQRRVILSMLWDTGMRVGELCRLQMSHLRGRSAVIENEKNHRSRLVAWTEETDKLLKEYLKIRETLSGGDEKAVFVSFKWKPHRQLSSRQIQLIFKEVALKAGLGADIRPHGMRHGFTHVQLHKKQPITVLAQMLGHSTVLNVLTYTQLNSREMHEAWGI